MYLNQQPMSTLKGDICSLHSQQLNLYFCPVRRLFCWSVLKLFFFPLWPPSAKCSVQLQKISIIFHERKQKFRGRGVQKEAISEGVKGCLQRIFPGGKQKYQNINITCQLLCQASYQLFQCYRSSKQVLLFALTIFYVR